MSTIITHSTGTITPAVVNGYEASRPARSIVHAILNSSDTHITRRPAGKRSGTLTLVFATGSAATAAVAILAVPQKFALSDPDVPQVAMSFEIATPSGDGEIVATLDSDTQTVWLVSFPYQEVTP